MFVSRTKSVRYYLPFAINKPHPPGNIMVHCLAGVSRSVTAIASFLIGSLYFTPYQAVRVVRSKLQTLLFAKHPLLFMCFAVRDAVKQGRARPGKVKH